MRAKCLNVCRNKNFFARMAASYGKTKRDLWLNGRCE